MACVRAVLLIWMEIVVAPIVTVASFLSTVIVLVVVVVWTSNITQRTVVRPDGNLGCSRVCLASAAGPVSIVTCVQGVSSSSHDMRLSHSVLILKRGSCRWATQLSTSTAAMDLSADLARFPGIWIGCCPVDMHSIELLLLHGVLKLLV